LVDQGGGYGGNGYNRDRFWDREIDKSGLYLVQGWVFVFGNFKL
jgi:hypothetical protein